MSPTFDAFLRSWPFAPGLIVALLVTAVVYLRGWLVLHRFQARRWGTARLAAFLGGLMAIFVALASPIEPFAALLLQLHMVQHMLLMMVAPPLIWLGAPLFPILRGLPREIRTYWVAPFIRSRAVRRVFERVTHPAFALLLFVGATWFWHIPAIYEMALRSSGWHYLQHACFIGAALLFWYPVVRPFPSRPRWSLWLLFPYLLVADVQNTVLAALLTFSDRVWYPTYASVPRVLGLSVLDDQAAAGVIMWVPGSLAFLPPLFAIGLRLLSGDLDARGSTRRSFDVQRARLREVSRSSLPILDGPASGSSGAAPEPRRPAALDLLRLPIVGRFLSWRHARLALQLPLAVLAAALIVDGLRGPQTSAMNLAGVLPWIHWRGLLIVGLLAAGNVGCMACPFQLPRTLARRWLPARRNWPPWLRSKWLAVVLVAVFLWSYEAFSLWDSPWWTAWIAVGYFVSAFVIDGIFRGASFCKYVCPIGQFNFVQSLVSPLEVKVREPRVCETCQTNDCIRGRDGLVGCEMGLFQPQKAGNLDCTFCLDCIHACPHDNIGIIAGVPGKDLWTDPVRSGVGRLAKRPDLAALVLVLVFGAFANAAGMVGPVLEWQDRLRAALGQQSPFFVVSAYYLLVLVVIPVAVVGASAFASRRWGRLEATWLDVATRYSFALVPLGFAMWFSHYSFHFLTSSETIIPTSQRFAAGLGWTGLGTPAWGLACCRRVADWLPRLEIVALELGLLLSLFAGYRLCVAQSARPSLALRAFSPWATLAVLLFMAGVWIVFQPMQMRGTLLGAR